MSGYETDTVVWSEVQAGLLRRRAAGVLVNEADIDWPNVAEEIDQLGKNQSRELASRVAVVMLHLLKLQASPATEPRAKWRETIREQRDEIERLLADAPSLRARLSTVIASEMDRVRLRAEAALADHGEQPRVDLDALPDHGEQPRVNLDAIAYTEGDVLGPWLP